MTTVHPDPVLPRTPAARSLAGRVAGLAGLAGVVLYVGTTALGGLVEPGYSHVRDAVSALTGTASGHRALLGAGYVAYNVAVAVFAVALARALPASRAMRTVALLTVVGAVAGIGQVTLFPQDGTGPATTTAGTVHLVLAGGSALVTILTGVLAGLAFRSAPGWRDRARFSLVCAALVVVTGGVGAAAVSTPVMGLLERLPIGTYLVWIAVLAVRALRLPVADPAPGPAAG